MILLLPRLKKTSITICPSFDSLRLYEGASPGAFDYVENKVDLKGFLKNDKSRKNLIQEIKSSIFSLNIRFVVDEKYIEKVKKEFCSYSINFNEKKWCPKCWNYIFIKRMERWNWRF